MTARTRRISAVLACAVLLTGCSSLLGDRTPHDDRFAEFTQVLADENKNLEIQTDAERLTRRLPGLHASEAHFVAQSRVRSQRELLPEPDRPYWIHAVAVVEPSAAQALDDASAGEAKPLPGIYPYLHQYVPKDCTFNTVTREDADKLLDVEHAEFEATNHWINTDEVAVSAQCNLVILMATVSHS